MISDSITQTTSSDMSSMSVTATQGDNKPSAGYAGIIVTVSGVLATSVIIIIFVVIVVLVLMR